MLKAILHRHTLRSAPDCTLGTLLFAGETFRPIYTLERPWLGNQRNVSCIPPGEYVVTPHDGEKFKRCWRLLAVPDRTAILIHQGNAVHETEGCILPGVLQAPGAVWESAKAMDLIRSIVGARDWMLRVTDDHDYLKGADSPQLETPH